MPPGRLLRAGVLTLIAPAGVLIGHALTYLVVVRDHAERAEVLATSGHAWWTPGAPAGAILAAIGLSVLTVAVLRRPPDGGTFRRELSRWLWPRLAAVQLSLFVVIETVERLIAGDPLSGQLYHEIVEHGLPVQLLIALAMTGACWCLTLVVDLACVAIARAPAPAVVGRPPSGHNTKLPLQAPQRLPKARAPPRLAC